VKVETRVFKGHKMELENLRNAFVFRMTSRQSNILKRSKGRGIRLDRVSPGAAPPAGALARGVDLRRDLGPLARTSHCRRLQLSRLPRDRRSNDVRSNYRLCTHADGSSPSVRQRATHEFLPCKHKYPRPRTPSYAGDRSVAHTWWNHGFSGRRGVRHAGDLATRSNTSRCLGA